MKIDSKTKIARNPARLKTNNSKHSGNDTGKKPDRSVARTKKAKGQLPGIEQGESIGSRQRLLATYEHAPIGIIENSLEGNYVNCNEEFCRITGYGKEELLTLAIKDLTYEEDYIFDIKLHQRLVAGEIPFYKLEKRYVRKDGQLIWAEVSRSLMRDAEGKPLYTIGAVLDVSERRQAEQSLRESEARLAVELADTKKLQHISSQLIQEDKINILHEQILDAAIALMRSDMGSIQILHPEKNELQLLAWKGFDPASAAFWEWVRVDSGSSCGVALNLRERVIVPDVDTCDFMVGTDDLDFYRLSGIRAVQSTPLLSRRGYIVGMISTHWREQHQPSERDLGLFDVLVRQAADLIERMQAEQALRESKERYYELFNLVPVAVYTCDADGLIQEYNQRAVELWGREPQKYDPDEKFCGSFKIFYPDGRFMPHGECPMARMLGGETLEPHELEILVERPDGARRNVIAHPLPLKNERGEIIGAINCLYDITERKQAEEALQQLNLQLESRVQKRTATIQAINQSLREEIAERKRAEDQLIYQARLIANVNDAIVATDENLVLTYWNQSAEQIYGWKAEEVMGRSVPDVLQTKFLDGNTRSDALLKVNDSGELRTAATQMRKDGTRIFVEAHTSTLRNEEGKTVGYISINRDVTERTQMDEALRKSRERLQVLSQRLVEVQEEERRAIARELHDRVGQTLAALNINLIIMNDQLLEDSKQRIGSRLDDSMHLVAEAIALVRDVMTDLRPAVLDDYGLQAALESYVDQYKSRYDIKVLLEPPDQPIPRLGLSLEMTLLRIAQEALFNTVRHAQADSVNVSLRLQDNSVHLMVQDNGVGIESSQGTNRTGSHGLKIMRERAEAFGGHVHVGSVPGEGTKVEASIPLQNSGQNKVREEKQ